MTGEERMIFETLYSKYNKLLLSKKECSSEINRSCSSLDRDRKCAIGMQYIKESNGNVYYPLTEIVNFIFSSQIKTFRL
ncbi:MAG: Unknown protein [uncultured Campylobacterales bacterium]|uniref:Uncharacterized protein n=1 Tax=uncultured Campylobacterales bacterium TaxID=352960 RepID=A0A6S6SJU8_9BACT|nr:MAG: Unknown protein [uncultured Campylobacterales bacterium]